MKVRCIDPMGVLRIGGVYTVDDKTWREAKRIGNPHHMILINEYRDQGFKYYHTRFEPMTFEMPKELFEI